MDILWSQHDSNLQSQPLQLTYSEHCLELENVKILGGGETPSPFFHSEWIILPLDDLWRHISFSGNRLLTRSGPPAESALLNPI